MNAEAALEFVKRHGVVLMSAAGPVPNLAQAIAGAPVRGSWWGHPKARLMYSIFQSVYESDQVLVCRLVGGKVTFVHRRLWPVLVRCAGVLPTSGLTAIREEHTPRGHHRVIETPFPRWVPRAVLDRGRKLAFDKARSQLAAAVGESLSGF